MEDISSLRCTSSRLVTDASVFTNTNTYFSFDKQCVYRYHLCLADILSFIEMIFLRLSGETTQYFLEAHESVLLASCQDVL